LNVIERFQFLPGRPFFRIDQSILGLPGSRKPAFGTMRSVIPPIKESALSHRPAASNASHKADQA
jgi:hypothetical protein